MRYQRALVEHVTPGTLFVRQWAVTVLGPGGGPVARRIHTTGKGTLFERLRGWLPGEQSQTAYADIGTALRMNEPAVRMAVHRLRQRYGELLRAEMAHDVALGVESIQEHMAQATSPRDAKELALS